ncbi:hypothetical protein JTE90_020450 [Oedothorax gibbosus]|uniref:Uncharacterized protein n=1 Tax=Oedothorax gibbosus TaxID=931172 RepID=A0AAV6UEY1_9ARAC|nr:hypothetical protein JTE90_020450 [Oedothorax gibbosus]
MTEFNKDLNLRIAYAHFPPFVIVTNKNGSLVLSGMMPGIINSVVKWMNISSLSFFREPEDRFGTWENNTFTGMVGMLYRNEVDLIMNPIMAKSSILEFAYFTNPITIEAYSVLSGKRSEKANLFLYFSALDTVVWYYIIITGIAISVTSAFMFISLNDLPHTSKTRVFGEYFWNLLSYMLRQNPSNKFLLLKSKRKMSLLIQLMVTLWMFGVGILVMTAFQSLLVSKMTVYKSTPIIDTLEDLLYTDATVGIAPFEIQLEDVLENSGVDVYEKAWLKIKPNLMSWGKVLADETIEDTEEGKYCILHGHLILENRLSGFYKEKAHCKLHLSKNYFFPFPLILAMQRTLPQSLFEVFNLGITRSVDSDIPGKYFKPALQDSTMCTSYSDKTLKPQGLENFYGVLLLWAAGLLCGLVTLFYEITYKNLCRDSVFRGF